MASGEQKDLNKQEMLVASISFRPCFIFHFPISGFKQNSEITNGSFIHIEVTVKCFKSDFTMSFTMMKILYSEKFRLDVMQLCACTHVLMISQHAAVYISAAMRDVRVLEG